jgi:hypothetical protein
MGMLLGVTLGILVLLGLVVAVGAWIDGSVD